MGIVLRPRKALVNCLNERKGHCTLVKLGGESLGRLEVGCRLQGGG